MGVPCCCPKATAEMGMTGEIPLPKDINAKRGYLLWFPRFSIQWWIFRRNNFALNNLIEGGCRRSSSRPLKKSSVMLTEGFATYVSNLNAVHHHLETAKPAFSLSYHDSDFLS